MKALDREQRDLDLAYGNTPPGLEKSLEADVERRMRDTATNASSGQAHHDVGSTGMRKNRSDNSFQNIEREEFEDSEGTEAVEEKKWQATTRRTTRRTTSSGGWNPTTWFSGGAAGPGPGPGPGLGDDGAVGEVAEEVRDAAQGMSSSIDRRR